MARLATRGYESQDFNNAGTQRSFLAEDGFGGPSPGVLGGPLPTFPTGWLGAGKALGPFSGANWDVLTFPAASTGRTVYLRCMVMQSALSSTMLGGVFLGGAAGGVPRGIGFSMRTFNTPGNSYFQVERWTSSGGTALTTYNSPVIAQNTWYRVEIKIVFSANQAATNSYEVRVDGATVETGSDLYLDTLDRALIGYDDHLPNSNSGALTHDDVAVNDDTGSDQNTWPGAGKVWYLLPTSDSARGSNWLGGAGGTTNLWDAINNTPPVGIAAATNTSQIKNAAKDTAGLYDAAIQSYDTAGIPSDHTITLVQALACYAPGGATAITHGLQVASNPVISEATAASAAVAAGTHPAGWATLRTAISYAPSVTRGTSPVLRHRKGTSSTTAAYFDWSVLMVESAPAISLPPKPVRVVGQAVNRSARWMRRHDRVFVPRLWLPGDPLPVPGRALAEVC